MCVRMHRHSIFCILPPHILHEIARNGTKDQRDTALRTLGLDSTARSMRTTAQFLASTAQAFPPIAAAAPQRTIYDAAHEENLPGRAVRSEGDADSSDITVNQAYDGLGATFDLYLKVYGRNSIDGHGMHLDATVHYGDRYDNAFWNGQQMIFGDGDGVAFGSFTAALDVIGHELSHGVTAHEANLSYVGQSGALNESFSDVMGSLVKQFTLDQDTKSADWLIGKGLLKAYPDQALRSMKTPGTAYDNPLMGKDPQPAVMRNYVQTGQDNGGVHINSGIPNHAFFLVADALGGKAWQRAGQIWYDTIRDPRLGHAASFSQFATRTVFNAGHRYGTASPEQKSVISAWKEVGVTTH
jgi:Zn-dependent metalloprotease